MKAEIELIPHVNITVKVYETETGILVKEQDINKSKVKTRLMFLNLNEVSHTLKVFNRNSSEGEQLSQYEFLPIKKVPKKELQHAEK